MQNQRDRLNLLVNGFVAVKDATGKEVFSKTTRVEDMPYLAEHAVDDELIFDSMQATTEVCETFIKVGIPDAEYVEGPYLLFSGEGQSLLQDALGKC